MYSGFILDINLFKDGTGVSSTVKSYLLLALQETCMHPSFIFFIFRPLKSPLLSFSKTLKKCRHVEYLSLLDLISTFFPECVAAAHNSCN